MATTLHSPGPLPYDTVPTACWHGPAPGLPPEDSPHRKTTAVSEETLLIARRFRVNRVKHQTRDGSIQEREVIRHLGAVVIVPCVDADHLCLIRNYRVAAGKTLIELPAGTLEPNEPPIECAHRELIEETGYQAGRLQPLTAYYAAPGILDEFMNLFVATDLTLGPPAREADEEIENLIVTWPDALQLIERGEICDAKTIAGILFYYQFHVLPRRQSGG